MGTPVVSLVIIKYKGDSNFNGGGL
jgi:hypothetical protein